MKSRELLDEPTEEVKEGAKVIIESIIAKYGVLTILVLVGVFLFVAKTYRADVLTEVSIVIMASINTIQGWIKKILNKR